MIRFICLNHGPAGRGEGGALLGLLRLPRVFVRGAPELEGRKALTTL